MVQLFRKQVNLFNSFGHTMIMHRRGIVRVTSLLLIVSLIVLVALIPTRGNAVIAGCDCDDILYSAPFAYDTDEEITITADMDMCAAAGAHNVCPLNPAGGICNSYSIDTAISLTSCGEVLSASIIPSNSASASSSCADAESSTLVASSTYVAIAKNNAMFAGFTTGATLLSDANIDLGSACCPGGWPCAGASLSLKSTLAPARITIPFELCQMATVEVKSTIRLSGACTSGGVDLIWGQFNVAGFTGSMSLDDSGSDTASTSFSLMPGEYVFWAEYEMTEGVAAELAGCSEANDGHDCTFADSFNVNVTIM